ncbi:hypothetical protein C5167_033772, partial [Papaver somniferum]
MSADFNIMWWMVQEQDCRVWGIVSENEVNQGYKGGVYMLYGSIFPCSVSAVLRALVHSTEGCSEDPKSQ